LPSIDVEIRARRQFQSFLTTKKRWSVAVAHRRAGKTVACIQKLTKAALEFDRSEGRFAYVAPLFNQAKDVAWTYLKRYAVSLGCDMNESELRIDFPNGARIRLYGADNPDRLRGLYLDGIVLDEYADMRASVWGEIIRPMLADRQGWATFIGTPKGKNEFFNVWAHAQEDPDWFALMLRASETGLISDKELSDAARGMTPEQYAQEFECSFDAAIMGAYFGKEIAEAERDHRVTELQIEPLLDVHTAWDLGMGDATSIWFFQVVADEIRFIDHYENTGQGLEHYVKELNARGYRYGLDYVPHDAKVRELGTGRSRLETLITLGRKPRLVPDHKLMDGINAARLTIPKAWFDARRCHDGLEALRQYRADYDEKAKTFRDRPKHDWTSHAADAFRYASVAWREMTPKSGPVSPKTIIAGLTKPKTLNDVIAEYEAERDYD
jgi:phage terminase large subunit